MKSTLELLSKNGERTHIFQSVVPATPDEVMGFHERADIFQKLAMPPLVIKINQDDRKSLTEGDIRFTLWFGPIPVKWHARHEGGPTPASFQDRQVSGPMQSWVHQHLFESVPEGTLLTDRITLSHKSGITGLFSRLFFDNLPLKMLFGYRHWLTRRILTQKKRNPANGSAR